jgi:ParB family chromosome partitioning protein
MGAAELGTEEKIIERVFGGLGKMTWASFVQNRLPILSYSDDLLDAVRTGQLSYTKAKELARVLDKDVRRPLLERVIGEALSLEETKRLVAAASEQKEPVSDYQHLAGLRKQLSPKRLDQLDARKRKQVDILLEKLRKILDPE